MEKLARSEVRDRFLQFEEQSDRALASVEADSQASPVLVAVVQEFSRKTKKAHSGVTHGDAKASWEAIIEVEQAGDSAKVAAEADVHAHENTRQAVLDAHLSICLLKAGM